MTVSPYAVLYRVDGPTGLEQIWINLDGLSAIAAAHSGTNVFAATYTRDRDNLATADTSQLSGVSKYKDTVQKQVCYAGSANGTACASPPTGSERWRTVSRCAPPCSRGVVSRVGQWAAKSSDAAIADVGGQR